MSQTVSSRELTIAHWNKTPLYFSEEERYSIYPWLYEAAEFRHHHGERVLEVGCGTGADLLQFAKHDAMATGIDITPQHLRLARERVGNLAEVRYGDAIEIPYDDATFDYVYCHGVLMLIETPRKAVEEIFRVLRPGGRFNVHVYAWWSLSRFLYMMKYGRDWRVSIENSRDPVYLDFYTGRKLRKLFAPAEISLRKYECYHFPALQRWLGWFLVAKGHRPE